MRTLATLLVLAVVPALLIALTPPRLASANGGADVAVELGVIDDLSAPQSFAVRLRNNGPDEAEYPIIQLDAGGLTIVDHTADPTPASRADGVGCTTDGQRLECSFDRILVGETVQFTVDVDVSAEATVRATVESAGTPDPNPQVNNTDTLLVRPATSDLAVTASVVDVDAAVSDVQLAVTHEGGRPTEGILTVEGLQGTPPDGCSAEDPGWVCRLGTLDDGDRVSATITVPRPQPDEAPTSIVLAVRPATLTDPEPSNDRVTVIVGARDAVPADIRRHQGTERVRTAVAVSVASFPEGARSAVLARADAFADALSGAPLAVDVGGPILLTGTGQLADVTAVELDRLLPPGATVHLLGGEAALSTAVEDAVTAAGYRVTRHAGPNRYGTSAAIAVALGDPDLVAFADGDDFGDAVVAAAAMAARGGALLLTSGARLPTETAPWASRATWAIGSPAARAVPTATDLAGVTPAETSVVVADVLFDQPTVVGIATTSAFPDALAGGPLTAVLDAPLLLTDGQTLESPVADYLAQRPRISTAHLFGGTGALSAGLEDMVRDLLTR